MEADRELEETFWRWRERGRPSNTLEQDLVHFLTAWQPRIGWQRCGELFRRMMAKQDWDIAMGGRRPSSPEMLQPRVRPRKGGITAYG